MKKFAAITVGLERIAAAGATPALVRAIHYSAA